MTGPSHGVCVTRSEAGVAAGAQVPAGRANKASSLPSGSGRPPAHTQSLGSPRAAAAQEPPRSDTGPWLWCALLSLPQRCWARFLLFQRTIFFLQQLLTLLACPLTQCELGQEGCRPFKARVLGAAGRDWISPPALGP